MQSGTPGVVEFSNIELLAPVVGSHQIEFLLQSEVVATYTVDVVLGDPARLIVANNPIRTYEARTSTVLDPFEIAIADFAGNLLGSSNTNEYNISAYVTGPRYVQ